MRIILQIIFKKIYLNRFGFEIDVEYKYASKTENHYEKENAHKLNVAKVKQIEEQLQAAAQRMVMVKASS